MAGKYKPQIKKLDYYETGGGGGGAVDSVNSKTGVVTLNQDEIPDGATYKQYSDTEKTKLAGIEALADVTDAQNVGSSIHGSSAKTTPVDADTVPLIDSAASNVLKKVTWANVKATLKSYFDTLYANITHTHAESDVTNLVSDLAAKEVLANKSTSTSLGTSNTLYPSQNAVKTYVDTQDALKKTDSMSTNKLLGRGTAGTGAIEEITLGTNLSLSGTTLNASGGGSSPADQANYTYSSTTTNADPGAGNFRLNRNTVDTVTNKALTNNIATITTSGAHGYAVDEYVYISIGDSVFDGWQRILTVASTTFTFAKTNANVTSAATSGTAFNTSKITSLYISATGSASVAYTDYIKRLQPGDTLVLANTTTSSKWLEFRVTSVPVDNTGWFTIGITYSAGLTPPANGESITIISDYSHASLTQSGNVLTWQSRTNPFDRPPAWFGSDGDLCVVLPSVYGLLNVQTNDYKNFGFRLIRKVSGAWTDPSENISTTRTELVGIIPQLGHSNYAAPVTGQAVSVPQSTANDICQPDWGYQASTKPAVRSSNIYYSATPGIKVGIGKGVGSFTPYNMAFFFVDATVQGLPIDTDTIRMTWDTATTATDPGTGGIKVNSATASSVTALYISELGKTSTVSNKQLTTGTATITTSAAHNLFAGQRVTITGVDTTFNGTYTIASIPTSTTFTYSKSFTVTNKALTANVATLTIGTHTLANGTSVTITGVDATFNGTYTLTGTTATTISYSKVAADVASVASSGTAYQADVGSTVATGSVNADITQQMNMYGNGAPWEILITQVSDATKFLRLSYTSNVDNGAWDTSTVAFRQVGLGGLPAAGQEVTVAFRYNNYYQVGNGYGTSLYGFGIKLKGDSSVSFAGFADGPTLGTKGGTAYVTNTSLTSNVATITTSVAHGFSTGERVVLANCTDTTYNGTYTITGTTTTTFTYAKTNANIGSAASIGVATTGATTNDKIVCMKYGKFFQAVLVDSGNTPVYYLPSSGYSWYPMITLGSYDALLGLQGLLVAATSRDHSVSTPTFAY